MEPSLQAVSITKLFPGVRALSNVSLDFYSGEVHALLGENGAGKSTLIKILSGVYTPTEGYVVLNGKKTTFKNPREALHHGISVIHQELSIANDLTVAENIFLGEELTKGNTVFVNQKAMNDKANDLLRFMKVHATIHATDKARDLTAAQQQMVEIAKVINKQAKVVIMDEPTSSLSEHEINALFEQIRILKEKNVTVIYISHRMKEIFEMCDRATVLRDGCKMRTELVAQTNENELVSSMVGREIKNYYIYNDAERGAEMLCVENLTREKEFQNISFTAYAGEILGISGLVGAGRTEVMETIFGARKADSGSIFVQGEKVHFTSPKDAIRQKIGLVTEDRRTTGLMIQADVKDNIVLPSLSFHHKAMGFLNTTWAKEISQKYVEKLRIKTPSIHTMVQNLSGGNQQKIILAKWLIAESEILILDEPTRGIDVNAKTEFYALMRDFVAQGGCIIMVSSELPEILGISDRILVMREGKISGELTRNEASEQAIIQLASQHS